MFDQNADGCANHTSNLLVANEAYIFLWLAMTGCLIQYIIPTALPAVTLPAFERFVALALQNDQV